MASTFHMTLEMRGEKEGDTVHFKNDGERFPDGQQNTVKFSVNYPYTFTVSFRPAKVLTHWMLRGEKMEFERVNPKNAEEDITIYQANWTSTGVEVTKRQGRYYLGMELELYPGLVMKVTLQTKFYREQETTHRKWGPEVHSVEYMCEIPEGQMSVNILQEKII